MRSTGADWMLGITQVCRSSIRERCRSGNEHTQCSLVAYMYDMLVNFKCAAPASSRRPKSGRDPMSELELEGARWRLGLDSEQM